MGEKKMMKKEKKSPSQKKVEPAESKPRRSKFCHYSIPISCPSFSINYHTYGTMERNRSGSGGITKSWISSPCTHQTYPQLVEINIHPKNIKFQLWGYDYSALTNIPIRLYSCTDSNRIVITGISSPAFAFYIYCSNSRWRTRDCTITEPYSRDYAYMELTNVIGSQGVFYAISRQGSLVVIERDGDSGYYGITALGRSRVVPYCQVSRHFREYLVEYKGEVYVVFLLSRVTINVVDDVEVLRLDKSRLMWEKVDRLVGDAMIFVQDDCCMGISASVLGCSKGSNCVYFTHDRAEGGWFVYDMKSSCISNTPGPEIDLI